MNRLTLSGVALLLLGVAGGGGRPVAGEPAVTSPGFRRTEQVWVNSGRGTFTDSGVRLGDGGDNTWTNPVLLDFDGDGDIDVFITNRSSGKHGLWFSQLAERRGAR